MNPLLLETKQLCRLYGIDPKKSLGQNFLIKAEIYKQIVDAAEVGAADTVLEVGPGLGFLTMALADRAKQVYAVELDYRLSRALPARLELKGVENTQIIQGDILKFPDIDGLPDELKDRPYSLVANLPYNISSHFLRRFLESDWRPRDMTLLLQKEVAERLVAKAGSTSLLSLNAQFYSRPLFLFSVSKDAFWPKPKVDSAVVRLDVKKNDELPLPSEQTEEFFRLARIGFSAKRKMLKNNLAAGLDLSPVEAEGLLKKAGFNPKARAQDLGLNDWLKLFGRIK